MPERVLRDPIGVRIKKLRERKGWNLSELAQRSGISRSYLYQIERGDSTPTQDKIEKLAEAFDALPSELLGEPPKVSEIPASLQQFAEQMHLGSAEVRMLAQIEYRGRKPSTTQEWKAIYTIITAMLEEDSEEENLGALDRKIEHNPKDEQLRD
jgi:transcriptional regulator with XRE-family HTH domain